MMIGIAATLTVTQPKSITELLLATGAGTVGALISDIDVGTSHSHKDADKVTLITAATVGAVLLIPGLYRRLCLTAVSFG